MERPKTFISYCTKDGDLAQRLKEDLSKAGCDSWQFDLSAIPGTDAWDSILSRIEQSKFFVVLLSAAGIESRGVNEELSYAHYCSINHPDRLPKIIPLILEEGIPIPRKITMPVRLPFREQQYNSDFEKLLKSLGIEGSPFAQTTDLDATFSRGIEFDVKRECEIYASNLIERHRDVSKLFDSLTASARAEVGSRSFTPEAQTVIWEEEIFRNSRQPQLKRTHYYKIMVVFLLKGGYAGGYGSYGRVITEISAYEDLTFNYEGYDLILDNTTLRLVFEGFRHLVASPLA